jgi:glycine cleavage system H protein
VDHNIPSELRYTTDNEWVRRDEDHVTIGVTDFAQEQLGDVVYVELPNPGDSITKGEAFGVVESVKAVSDLIAPLSGAVIAINETLAQQPELVNASCYGEGWMLQIKPADEAAFDSLLDPQAYEQTLSEQGS